MSRMNWTNESLARMSFEDRSLEEIFDLHTLFQRAFSSLPEEERTVLMEYGKSLGYSINQEGQIVREKPYRKLSLGIEY